MKGTPMVRVVLTHPGGDQRSPNSVPLDAFLRDRHKTPEETACPGCGLCRAQKEAE